MVASFRSKKCFLNQIRIRNMSTKKEPFLKRLMDNPWLLLVLGVIIPFLSYTVWGWIEILLVKPAQLP